MSNLPAVSVAIQAITEGRVLPSFVLDPSSPGYGASLPVDDGDGDWEDEGGGYVDEECDYMILSRSVIPGTR